MYREDRFQALDICYKRYFALKALKEFVKGGEGEFISD